MSVANTSDLPRASASSRRFASASRWWPCSRTASTALDHNFSGSCGFLPAASFSRRHGRSEYQSRMRLPPRHPRTNGSRSRLGPVGSPVTVCSVPVFAVTACFTSCRQLPVYSCAASFVARSSFLPFQLIFERTEPCALPRPVLHSSALRRLEEFHG